MEETKVQAIRNYLEKHFPHTEIHDKDDFDRCGHKFRISWENSILLTSISRKIADDNSEADLIGILENYDLPALLKRNPGSIVLVERDRCHAIPVT